MTGTVTPAAPKNKGMTFQDYVKNYTVPSLLLGGLYKNLFGTPDTSQSATADRVLEDYIFITIGVVFIIVGIILAVATSSIGSKTIEVASKAAATGA